MVAFTLLPPTLMEPNPGKFRILSLDGGGIKGAFSVSFLSTIEEMTGKNIIDHFDLITGTSTGGIIAIALAMGIPAVDILRFYRERGPHIFPVTGLHRRLGSLMHWMIKSKYSSTILRTELESILGDRKFGEAKCRLVIPSFNADNGDVYLFKTAHHPRLKQDYKLPAVDVALATSAAPTYFPAFTGHNGLTYVDGGVWANCPVTVGIVEAISFLDMKREKLEVLSIGTTCTPFSLSQLQRTLGGLLWNTGIIGLQMQAQAASAIAQAKVLSGGRLVRIDVPAKPKRFSLDDSRKIGELVALGATEARHRENEISTKFLGSPAPQFIPIYK